MKVLYFHQHFTTPKGAGGTRSYEFAKHLVSHGHEVSLICGNYIRGDTGLTGDFVKGRRQGAVDGIKVIELKIPYSNKDNFLKRTWKFFLFSFKSMLIVFNHDHDIIFASSTPLTAGIPGIFSKLISKKPFIFEVRDLWPEGPKAMGAITNPLILILMSFLEWFTYKSADRIIGLSPGIVEGIRKRTNKQKSISMIPNGCDIEFFSNSRPGTWSHEELKERDFLAIYSGTHGMTNGLDILIDTAEVLNDKGAKEIKIILVGDGSQKESLIGMSRKKGLKNLIFMEPQGKDQLAVILDRADLGLQILKNIPEFYYGTSPNKFFDYLAIGLPVLVNYPGWIADIIKEEDIGFVSRPEDPESFADKLIEATKDIHLAEKSKNSLRLARQKFNRKTLANNFEKVLLESLQR